MNNKLGWLFGGAALAMVAILVVSGVLAPGMTYKDPIITPATQVLTSLLITTLFVERAMGVLNALLFGDKQREAELKHLNAVEPEEQAAAARAIAEVLAFKERLRLLLGFGAGLFVAAAGVRTLDAFFTGAPSNPSLFYGVDAVLTAGLIAGGSNGLAFLLQLLKDRFAASGAPVAPATTIVVAPEARDLSAAPAPLPSLTTAQLRARLTTTS